jgi:MFS family permease
MLNRGNVSGAMTSKWAQSRDHRFLMIASLGAALEFYDFIIFVYFSASIGRVFFPVSTPAWLLSIPTFGLFGAGYLARPLGGVVLAHFGDLFGRKHIFLFSILLMAFSTLGIAVLPTYSAIGASAPLLLLLMRVLQGAAIGGEVPGSWTFVSEHVPLSQVGLACGLSCAGLGLGIMFGSLTAYSVSIILTTPDIDAFGWRIPFVIGGVFGLIAVHIRQWLRETPIFSKMQMSHKLIAELPLRTVIRDYPHGTIVSVLLTWVLSACILVTTMLNSIFVQKTLGYSAEQAFAATTVGTMFLCVAAVLCGAIVDTIGAAAALIGGGIFFAIATLAFYTYAGASLPVLFGLYALLGTASSLASIVPYVMVRAFPARVRFTGISFSYNCAYAFFGGLTPVLLTGLELAPLAHMIYLLFIALLAVCIGGYLQGYGNLVELDAGIEELP